MVAEPYPYAAPARNREHDQPATLRVGYANVGPNSAARISNSSTGPAEIGNFWRMYIRHVQLRRTFEDLTADWRRDTRHLSFDRQIAMHPAYQEIVGMGTDALPYIFEELQREPDHWFWALTTITRDNPVPPSEAGDIEQMRQRWLEWGRRKGYVQRHAA
jgi:hypothetical protein